MLGNQEYSITIGNKNYTLDWLTPVSMPLFAGVELHKAKVDGGEMSFEELIDAIGRVADPITNLSLLQGVNDAMSEYDSGLYRFARSAAESFAGQFVPTVFGQVARSIDPPRRTRRRTQMLSSRRSRILTRRAETCIMRIRIT